MNRKAISRMTAAIVIVIIVVLAGVGIGLYSTTIPSAPQTTATQTTAATGALRDTLTIDETWWPGYDLNPISSIATVTGSNWFLYTMYQSLLTVNGSLLYRTGEVQVLPMLATDWSVSPDGTVYTFNLRQNVAFSNGDPFNAYQVWGDLYNFYYLLGNASSFLNGYKVFDVSNVKFGPATIALMTQSGLINPTSDLMSIMSDTSWPIYVTGPYQIVFHLKAPFHWFPAVLTMYVALILDTQYILTNGGFGTPMGINTYFNQHAIPGTGPYVVTDFQVGEYQKFEQDPNYWGRNLTPADIQANPYLDPGHVKTVFVYGKTDDVVRYTDLSTGIAQIASIYQQNWPLVLANREKYDYYVMPSNSMILTGIGLNTMRYPTNITAFRLAIVHAVNLTDVNQKVYFGTMAPFVGPEYSGVKEFYNLGNFQPYSYDLDLAKKYLAESGVDISKLQPLEFRVMAGCTSCVAAAQVVQAHLSQIGITVTVMVTPPSQFSLPYVAGTGTYSASILHAQEEAHMAWLGFPTWAPTVPTPADAWLLYANYNSPVGDYANYANPTIQKCVDAWFSTADVTVVKNYCTAAQAQYYNDAPYIWLGSPTLAFGAGSVVWDKSVVKGFLMDPTFTGESTTAIFNTVTFVG